MLALVLVAWFTGEEEGAAAFVHRFAGEAIAGLIVFRVIWGFAGGEHGRFADFAAGPTAIIAHVRNLFSGQPKRHLGHNPLGGIAVFLLLATVTGVVVTGLFSGGDFNAGPFVGLWGLDVSQLHEILFRVLQGLVLVHVLGVIVETVKTKDALVPAMFSGRKRRSADDDAVDAKRARPTILIVAPLIAAAATFSLLGAQPRDTSERPQGAGFESEQHQDQNSEHENGPRRSPDARAE